MDDDPGVGWTPEESDGKRDWPTIIIGSVVVLVFLAAVLLAVSAAYAEGKCAPHDALLVQVGKDFHEVHVVTGIMNEGQSVMELWVSSKRTWTIIARRSDDWSCILMYGTTLMISGNVPPLGEGM